MKSAIDVDRLARGEIEFPIGDGADGFADIPGQAPSANRRQTFGNQFVVFFFDDAGHIGRDDAGPDFEDADIVWGQAIRKQCGYHAHARLADTIFGAGRRTGVGRDRTDINNPIAALGILLLLFDHPVRYLLGQKKRSFQINVHYPVVTFCRGFQYIQPFPGPYAGIVDQQFASAEFFLRQLHQRFAIRWTADIASEGKTCCPQGFEFLLRGFGAALIRLPIRANSNATPLPIPRLAPVTIAIFRSAIYSFLNEL